MGTGTVEDRPRCGRPLSTAPQQDCPLLHRSLTDKMVTSRILLCELHNVTLIQPPEELEEDTEVQIK